MAIIDRHMNQALQAISQEVLGVPMLYFTKKWSMASRATMTYS